MSSKRLFSWSRRQSNAEPYYRTGGLLPISPIETSGNEPNNSSGVETQNTQKADRKRPSNLTIVPPDHQQFTSTPLSSPRNAALTSSTSNLMAIFNDMLRSPALSASACPRSASIHKALPTRPRSNSVPATPEFPAELPGSLLQDNQGFPYLNTPDFAPSRPTSQNIRRGTHPTERCAKDEGDVFDLLHLFPEPLNHSKSSPSLNLGYQHSAMKSSRTGTASSLSAVNKSKPHRVQRRRPLSEVEWRTQANPIVVTNHALATGTASVHASSDGSNARIEHSMLPQSSPLALEGAPSNSIVERRASRRDDFGASTAPAPTTSRNRQTEDLEVTVATQDQTISTLQSQFSSLRSSHEAHVSSLADAHAAELASLRNYTKALEEQLAQRPSLHHASSNNLLFLLDTTESSDTPSRGSSQHTTATSASSATSFRSAPEKQQRSSGVLQDCGEMESLKRKLSTTRRPETANRNLLPELNQYKQNNVALQTQISSLMAKLNESKKSEKALRATLQDVEQRCAEWEGKAGQAQQLESSVQALQNTIDHLENRLEIANTEKLDAQEEIFNMRALKSPFDAQFPELQKQWTTKNDQQDSLLPVQDAHVSMDTVFSTDSASGHERNSSEPATLSAFVTHVEQLQDEIRHKDQYISDLEDDSGRLRQMLGQANHQCDEINLQLDIQNELLRKATESDRHVEQLRIAIIDREAIIGEKEKAVRAIERQLELHKLLLKAEIRKHATMSRYLADENDPLPELTALATKKDIDKWIHKLNQRLRKEKSTSPTKETATAVEIQLADLRDEIDFYVREIIYYKLDIRGYKSDIKKLNRITAQFGNYGGRASDLESDTSSLRPTPTPHRTRFLSTTPELRGSAHPSPALAGPTSANIGSGRTLTPPPSTSADSPDTSPSGPIKVAREGRDEAFSKIPTAPQTPTQVTNHNITYNTPVAVPESPAIQHGHGSSTPMQTLNTPDFPGEAVISNNSTMSQTYDAGEGMMQPVSFPGDRPDLERGVSDAPTVRPVVPTSRFSKDLLPGSASQRLHQTSHTRAGSGSSTTSYNLHSHSSSRPERSMSASSTDGIPFVIAMGSPHNPAIAVAAKNMPASRYNAALKSPSTTSRTGVDGTMASSTPLSSPTCAELPTNTTMQNSLPVPNNKRKLSLSFRKQENGSPTTPTHSRSISGGSIRTAIRWPMGSKEKEKEKDKDVQTRKDSIGMPRLLASPFAGDWSTSLGSEPKAIDFAAGRDNNL